MEAIEPITDDEEKEDIHKLGGDWRDCLAQAFDVIPLIEGYDDLGDELLAKWFESFRTNATRKARSKFGSEERPKHELFLTDDTSTVYWSAISFTVGGLRSELAKTNRELVLTWADSVFQPLLDEQLLLLSKLIMDLRK